MSREFQPVEGEDLISQFPAQFEQIVNLALENSASTGLPVQRLGIGRMVLIVDAPASPAEYRGWVCMYLGQNPNGTPNWQKLFKPADAGLLASAITSALQGKQATIGGAASTVVSSNLTALRVLVSDGSGKIAASSTVAVTALDRIASLTSDAQAQLNAKQPVNILSTVDPTAADATGKPNGTLWLVYVP